MRSRFRMPSRLQPAFQATDRSFTARAPGSRDTEFKIMLARLYRALGCPYAEIWLPGYLRREASRMLRPQPSGTRHLLFCFVDHYEPHVGKVDDATARRRLDAWLEQYPRIADRHEDCHGRLPTHS